jgi:uncharacterized membrane protein YbhN (UPF0104 family)
MQKPTLKKVGKRALQIVLPVAILLWIIYAMRDDWHQLATYKFQWNPWLVMLAFIGFLLQELSYGLIWRAVLARLGSHLALRTCLRIYLASEFVRYIPGNVWHVLTRILWVGKYGVSRPIAFASMTVELITKLAAGAFVFAVSLLFWGDVGVLGKLLNGTPILALLGVGTMFALLVGLHPRVLNGLMNGALHLLKRDAVVLTLRYRDILLVTLAWCASWFVAGCACFVLLLALWPAAPLIALPLCIGIYALVWDIGFVSFITPSGLGIREGAMVGLFALVFPLPLGLSAILAVVSRVVSTLAELICVGIAYLSGGQQMRAVQQQLAQPATPKDEEEGPATDEHLYEASEQIDVVKGGVVSD